MLLQVKRRSRFKRRVVYFLGGVTLGGIATALVVTLVLSTGITRSTRERSKLTTTKEFIESCVDSDGDYLVDQSQTGRTLQSFYTRTGVQPYVYIIQKQSSNNLEQIANNYFTENSLGSGSMLLVYASNGESYGDSYIKVGSKASEVIDDEAQKILIDYLKFHVSEIPSLDACITKAFYDTAEDIMGKAKIPLIVYPALIIGITAVVVFLLYDRVIILARRRRQNAKREWRVPDGRESVRRKYTERRR